MKNNVQNDTFKEDNYIKAWIKQTENPELYKNFNDLEDQSYTNEFIKIVDFNNFNSNFINKLTEDSHEIIEHNKKRKAYCLFYSNEFESDSNYYNVENNDTNNSYNYNNNNNNNYNNINNDSNNINNDNNISNNNNTYPFSEDSEIRSFKALDKTPSRDMEDTHTDNCRDENLSIKKLKRESDYSENNYDMLYNNFMNSYPYLRLKNHRKSSYGSESTNEFFNSHEFETPIKSFNSKNEIYDFKYKKGSSTNTTKDSFFHENISSNNSETKRTINFSNKTEYLNNLHSNLDDEYISPEYVDKKIYEKSTEKKSGGKFIDQKLDYKVVGNVINYSKSYPRFTMFN